jgi:hypothetical protein
MLNSACYDGQDCVSTFCVGDFGKATCGTGTNGSLCFASDDCASKHCVSGPGFQAPRQCSAGGLGDYCDVDTDCVAPHNCVNGPGFQDGNICTEGKAGDPCESANDCIGTTCDGSQCVATP